MITANPFDLNHSSSYEKWRAYKLRHLPEKVEDLIVEIKQAHEPNKKELKKIQKRLKRNNMAIYRFCDSKGEDRDLIKNLASQFRMTQLDYHLCSDNTGITALSCDQSGKRERYIPYTNKPINWHADGYYNSPGDQIRGMILHCVRQAGSGGENFLADPEMLYIYLRDKNPEYIRALMKKQVLCIPANEEEGQSKPRCGPVFSVNKNQQLHLRFTIRKRNVIWDDEALVAKAVSVIHKALNKEKIPVYRYKLQSGEGLICNNVLHGRERFEDQPGENQGRLMYRARFFDRAKV